jgi:hypothetical protein
MPTTVTRNEMNYTYFRSTALTPITGVDVPIGAGAANHRVRQRHEWQLVRLRNKRGRQEFWRLAPAGEECDCSPPAA